MGLPDRYPKDSPKDQDRTNNANTGNDTKNSLRRLFLADAPRDKIWEQAVKEGLVSMRQDGMLKVKSGITTPYEVMRVLFSLD